VVDLLGMTADQIDRVGDRLPTGYDEVEATFG
jgi:hypothetical protein